MKLNLHCSTHKSMVPNGLDVRKRLKGGGGKHREIKKTTREEKREILGSGTKKKWKDWQKREKKR